MKKLFLIVLTIISLKSEGQITINASLQKKYLPDVLKGLYIGVSKEVLLQDKSLTSEVEDYYIKKFKKGNIISITYQIDTTTVYEFIVEYKPNYKLYDEMLKKYGKPNDGKEWKFVLDDGLTLKIWYYKNKLCIANAAAF